MWAFALVALLALSGCASHDTVAPSESAAREAAPQANQNSGNSNNSSGGTSGIAADALTDNGTERSAAIATATHTSIDIWDEPGGAVVSTVDAADVLTAPKATPLVFLVKSQQVDWYEVYLPVRPNGSTGWVRGSEVRLTGTEFALDVYLADHTLVLSKGGEEQARYPLGVGRSDRPTPGGVYYLRELLVPPDPTDVYGPYAYGLSGFSPVLDSFRGGDAVIGLHGTDEPASIGGEVSSGCLRMNNADVTELVEDYGLPLGTPVYIHD